MQGRGGMRNGRGGIGKNESGRSEMRRRAEAGAEGAEGMRSTVL